MDSDFRVDEAKPCSAGARSGDRGGPDPTCRAVTAVDAESAAAPNASDRSATFPASRWRKRCHRRANRDEEIGCGSRSQSDGKRAGDKGDSDKTQGATAGRGQLESLGDPLTY
jgi:hypothetical protein